MTEPVMTDKPATQADRECAPMFNRPISHDEARQAAINFIDAHFKNKKGKGVRTSVPTQTDDDDILLTDYIRQQRNLNAAKDARITELEAALKPFADCVEYIDAGEDDEEWAKFRLLIKDYRRAAQALKGETSMTPEQMMDKQAIAAMDLALSHIGMDVPEKTVREMAQTFLNALADDLPDEMVERGLLGAVLDGDEGTELESTVNEHIGVIVGRSFLQAALKGGA